MEALGHPCGFIEVDDVACNKRIYIRAKHIQAVTFRVTSEDAKCAIGFLGGGVVETSLSVEQVFARLEELHPSLR